MKLSLDGRLLEASDAALPLDDRGLLLGDGLFETLRAEAGRALDLEAHLERLRAGARALKIPLPEADLPRAIDALLAANGLSQGSAALRITLTRGSGPRGLLPPSAPRPRLFMTAVAWTPPPREPLRAILAGVRRNEHSPLSRLKTLNYLDNVLARLEAEERGADEALMLNTAGRLVCATAANLFLVRGRRLFTPPVTEGVLPGIARASVLDLAPRLDLSVAEVPLEPAQLWEADEAFLTNSLIGLRSVVEVDGRAIGDVAPGPVTVRLKEALDGLR